MTLVPIKRLEFAASWPRLHYLARRIAPNSRVLNIGIGGGEFETAADRRELELFQLDPSLKTVEAARQRSEVPQRVSIGYVQDMPFDNDQFDAVVASELLEHLTDEILAAALVEIARVLRPGSSPGWTLSGYGPCRGEPGRKHNVLPSLSAPLPPLGT